ncbi:MAG TPA: hypothetical protein VLH40_05885 [Atribacteraceae bacterium]|nr:hypothetical protein [Atribacteraceae bacterium]
MYRLSLDIMYRQKQIIAREREKGKQTFREISGNIPALQGPVGSFRMALKGLSQDHSWVPSI